MLKRNVSFLCGALEGQKALNVNFFVEGWEEVDGVELFLVRVFRGSKGLPLVWGGDCWCIDFMHAGLRGQGGICGSTVLFRLECLLEPCVANCLKLKRQGYCRMWFPGRHDADWSDFFSVTRRYQQDVARVVAEDKAPLV